MKITLIYPKWPKLSGQTTFNLPPHGPVCFAATIPDDIEVEFIDENCDPVPLDLNTDLIAISSMLTCQMPRAWELAEHFRSRGIKVIAGGIGATLHAEETMEHVDAIFLGESEGRFAGVLDDFRSGRLKKVYDYLNIPPPIDSVGTARRSILNQDNYSYRGIKMLSLVHASRGCKFNCYPCSTAYLGGRKFRPRPIDKVVEELEAIDNNRLFIVDNSLAQDKQWLLELFAAITPLKKKWVSHPILDDDEVIEAAAKAGCWYVYQAIFDTSDFIKRRIQRLKDHGIGIEGTILLGMDNHDEEYIKRLVNFLLEIDLDMAEFTILTPFPHAPVTKQLKKHGRIFDYNWINYTTDKSVFYPKHMSPEKLEELYAWSWKTFYSDMPQEMRMARLFQLVIEKEIDDGTFQPRRRAAYRKKIGEKRNINAM